MPGRGEIVLVSGAPVDADNWVYRRFIDAGFGPEVTFFGYDETSRLTLTQWDAIKAARDDDGMRKLPDLDRKQAQLDLPREHAVTNRKARRAAAAKRRQRQ